MTILTRQERERLVLELYYNQGKTTREIAQIERMSIRDISAILKEEEARRQKYEHQQHQEEISSKAYKLFSEGKTSVEVAVILNLREPEVTKYNREYWKLKGLDKLNTIHAETNGNAWPLWKLYRELVKKRGMSIAQVVNVVEIAIYELPHMETLYIQAKDQAEKMQRTIQRLSNDIAAKEYKISLLDKIAFTSEQDGKRAQQQVQELIDKKDRIEKLIANTLNGGGYSKLKQFVKENVKAVLANNKQLISISFVALIQTLKDNPEMANLIYNIPSVNDGEQYKDNNDNNNIVKYLESNKDSILGLAEKQYENLVEALTNNAIAIPAAASSSSSPALSLPQSSSTFPGVSNQTDTRRIEHPESFHRSKGDIDD
jgi:DNA-binding CsgD family transcriptional regulator